MYYLFVAKDLHITAYIGKKVNNTIAKCNIKLVREINSYRVCYTDTLINLNVVTIYKLGDSELIYKFIEDVKAITEIELELLNKINYCINNDKSFKVSNLHELRKLDQYIIFVITMTKNIKYLNQITFLIFQMFIKIIKLLLLTILLILYLLISFERNNLLQILWNI